MWPFSKKEKKSKAPVFFTNTLSSKKELFVPIKPGLVSIYSCGPTVYGPIHVGNLRSFILADLTARVLKEAGYRVRRVMNITDVGHLVGDGDEGDDKIAVGAAREKTTPEEIAERYTKLFIEHIKQLNIETEDIRFPRASNYISEQIVMIKTLEEKGLTYKAEDGLYFDTDKFPAYGQLVGLNTAQLKAGARVKMSGGKKNAHDFALWRYAKKNDLQKWESPWGTGNPGWSIECSAMSRTLLGTEIDIHTGGEDLASIHHNNEIAQSEGSSGRPFVRYWIHGAFLTMEGEKVSKSLGNTYSLDDVVARGIDPLALRYFFLQAHYRSPLSFSWESLEATNEALTRLRRLAQTIKKESKGRTRHSDEQQKLIAVLRDDLATPQGLALLWESLKDEDIMPEEKMGLLTTAEKIFGLSLLVDQIQEEIPEDVIELMEKREKARQERDFAAADQVRIHIENRGYHVEDGPSGPLLSKIRK